MEPIILAQRRTSREEMVTGVGGSILVHVLAIATAILAPQFLPHKSIPLDSYTVNLVSMQDLGGPPPPLKGAATKSSEAATSQTTQKAPSKAAGRSTSPVVPVKRLQMDDPAPKPVSELKKIEAPDKPKVQESQENTASVEKSLDKLIPKPKPAAKPTPVVQNTKETVQEDSVRSAPTEAGGGKKGEKGALPPAAGNPEGSSKGNAEGIAGASGQGGRVSSALLAMWGEKVKSAIRSQWALVDSLKEGGLETHLIIVVSRDGKVMDVQVEKQSGNAMFDESARRAVRKASPLPPFPDAVGTATLTVGLRFRPEGLS